MVMVIVHELRKASGSNKKKEILRKHKLNSEWIKFLTKVYDPFTNYYVSSPKDFSFVDEVDMEEMYSQLDMLSSRQVTGKAAREWALSISEEFGEASRLILSKSINAEISDKTINSVYENLIPTFPVMLAEDVEVPRFPVMGSIKYDGVRVIVAVDSNGVDIRTRSGLQLPIKSLIKAFSDKPYAVYDGELVKGSGKMAGRTKITGDVNKVLRGTATDIEDYSFHIFDCVNLDDWEDRLSVDSFLTRLHTLNDYLSTDKIIKIVEQTEYNSPEEIEKEFERLVKLGFEGLILRYPEDPYVWGRSPALIKKKSVKPFLLKCVGTNPGTGKYEGLIGSLICEGEVENTFVRVNIGSGLSEPDRDKEPEEYIGVYIDGCYNSITETDDGSHSLFLPRFKRLKGDYNV